MTDLLHEPEAVEERSEEQERDDAIAEHLLARRPEPDTGEPEQEEVASTETPEVEAPPEHEDESGEPTQAQETDEERELRHARVIAREMRDNPDLGDALVALKQGKASLIDREVLEAAQRFMAEQPKPEIAAEPDDFEDRFWSDPIAVLREIKGETESFKHWQAQQAEARSRQDYEANTNLMTTVGEEWQATHPELTDDHVGRIVQAVGETNLIARSYARHGDKARAIREGLEAGLRLEFPELIAQQRTQEAIREANRKRRAGATAASPRSVPRTTEDRPTPRNSAERVEQLAGYIREMDEAQQ